MPSAPQNFSRQTSAALLAMLLIDSFHLIFARALAPLMSPYSSSFYVLAIASLQIAGYLSLKRLINWNILKQHFWFFLSISFLIAAATVCSYTAVSLIDAGTASLLGRISTLITLALSYFWLKEKLSEQELMGAVLCILGAFTISFQGGDIMRLGSVFVLASVIFYALHIAIVKRYGEAIEFHNFFFFRVLMSTVFLGVFMAISKNSSLPPSAATWLILVVTATVDVLISRLLYYWALRQMRLGIHTLVLTLTPVLTIIWSILFFNESPSWQGLAGGVLVLVGIFIVGLAKR